MKSSVGKRGAVRSMVMRRGAVACIQGTVLFGFNGRCW
ncbi:hypothetical protein FOCG_10215 [Fusarium oxysporum f. sp. radicis-lycopersici 26381]|uniref:Uncharacterized protein n=3 Tax=Fusarium oxysporum TaxID=5507 RepID=A0A0J9U6R1_FUSO4|nr:hypothetical protein FOXG_17929 [Fusarium oxysporum f. sp. lycopersici 4287]EWZ51272.1 hypothetical protein FOZG_01420 [Fusarium oxysporum Fo47]EWZ91259.1 hypothetical protein FOWG_06910 [Fusarium oxysporum f. sp. lycopersici MN25]EXK48541.1 hypothetical protein FOMG_01426 [Fusarium oxysporum f. sp. melonis 26406]EXL50153.1 hypothetical protein FOCG_10215 [Fusarium oxysporum f. sp. radicis-lycopersici 26381]KNA94863.1 hypothetical protein FOXG_17929 [Fusarium oxysporum f. sp. lycopersici 42